MASKSSKAIVAKGKQSNSHERTAKATCVNKRTGAYAYSATKEVISTVVIVKDKSTGRVGIKNECSNTKTWRVGDKSGYSECQVRETFRRVDYGVRVRAGQRQRQG